MSDADPPPADRPPPHEADEGSEAEAPPDASAEASEEDPAEASDPELFAPHRILFHGLVIGACGGLLGGGTMTIGQLLRRSSIPWHVPVLCLVIGVVWSFLLGVSARVARQLRPQIRWLVVIAIGALSALAVACAFTGVEGLIRGGPTRGWREVTQLLQELLNPGRDLAQILGIGAGCLVSFGALGTARAGIGPEPAAWWIQLVVGTLGSIACYVIFVTTIRGSIDNLHGFVFIAGGGIGATVGAVLGDPLERKLLTWITRYRNK